jgi:hypothetical protein
LLHPFLRLPDIDGVNINSPYARYGILFCQPDKKQSVSAANVQDIALDIMAGREHGAAHQMIPISRRNAACAFIARRSDVMKS